MVGRHGRVVRRRSSRDAGSCCARRPLARGAPGCHIGGDPGRGRLREVPHPLPTAGCCRRAVRGPVGLRGPARRPATADALVEPTRTVSPTSTLRDPASEPLERVSVERGAARGRRPLHRPDLSADGRYVRFTLDGRQPGCRAIARGGRRLRHDLRPVRTVLVTPAAIDLSRVPGDDHPRRTLEAWSDSLSPGSSSEPSRVSSSRASRTSASSPRSASAAWAR